MRTVGGLRKASPTIAAEISAVKYPFGRSREFRPPPTPQKEQPRKAGPMEVRRKAEFTCKQEIEKCRTPKGGFTKETLAKLGIGWPPAAGWIDRLVQASGDRAVSEAGFKPEDELRERQNLTKAKKREIERELNDFYQNFRRREKERRAMQGAPSIGVDFGQGAVPNEGEKRINRKEAQILMLHLQKKSEWTAEMVEAHRRFSRDFALAQYRGINCKGFDPKVDGSSGNDGGALAVICQMQLKELEREIGRDYYMALVLFAGYGYTLSEMKAHGLGDKRVLSENVKRALQLAAVFYRCIPEAPPTKFLRGALKLIEAAKADAPTEIVLELEKEIEGTRPMPLKRKE